MLEHYFKTSLELSVDKLYKEKGIHTPADLSIEEVANQFNFGLQYLPSAPSRVIWDEELAVIFLNPNYSLANIREVFFHEICHPLRHCGDQENMPISYRDMQEEQANNFKFYAAMPFYMIKQMDIPSYEQDFIAMLSYVFDVPLSFAKKRVEQIKRRVFEAKMVKANKEKENLYKRSNDPDNWSEETRNIMDQLYGQLKMKGGAM
jgi:Zn-dependent peptidase ImmA (M78 family)